MIDFKDFVRLSEFLDSTIYKLSKDSSPARSNTSVGITIEPTILERTKGVDIFALGDIIHFAPVSIYSLPKLSQNPSKIYDWASDNKMAYFTGNISGNRVSYYTYFQSMNENKYARNTSFNSDDTYAFNHSLFSALLNNVKNQKNSSIYQKVEYLSPLVSSTSGSANRGINEYITIPYTFQDSYLNTTYYSTPRYNGSKNKDKDILMVHSTSGSLMLTNNKIAVFNSFNKDRFLPGKSVLELRYLSNESGSLTVLNSSNKSLGDLQRLFSPGEKLSIGYFKNSKAKFNKRTIYESGYSYRPVLYFASSSVAANHDSALNFELLNGGYDPDSANSINGNVAIKIQKGITKLNGSYPDYNSSFTNGSNITIYGIFDFHNLAGESNANGKYINSSFGNQTKAKFIAATTTSYNVYSKIDIQPEFVSGGSVSYNFKMYKNGSLYKNIPQTGQNKAEVDFYFFDVAEADIITKLNEFLDSDPGSYSTTKELKYVVASSWSYISTEYYTKINVYSTSDYPTYTLGGLLTTLQNTTKADSFRVERYRSIYYYDSGQGYYSEVTIERQSIYNNLNQNSSPLYTTYARIEQPDSYTGATFNARYFPNTTKVGIQAGDANQQISVSFLINENLQLLKDDYLEFEMIKNISSGTMTKETILSGDFTIKGTNSVKSVGITLNPADDTILFSDGLSFVYGNSRFIPYSTPPNNNSKAWADFLEVYEDFSINNNSFALFVYTPKANTNGENGVKRQLLRIKSSEYSTITSRWTLKTEKMPSDLVNEIVVNKVDYKVCFLSRFKDETNIILSYSYTDSQGYADPSTYESGFLIPASYNPSLLDQLDSVVSSLKNNTNLITNI